MTAKREYLEGDTPEDEILDALVERGKEGMTVLEIRAYVDADINEIEASLTELKNANLITVTMEDGATRIKPDDKVIPDEHQNQPHGSLFEKLKEYFSL